EDIIDTERIRFECSKKLFLREWDFFFVLFTGTDVLQHRMYNELVGNKNHPGIELYKNLDQYVKWFVDNSPDNAVIFLISDHGFKTFTKTFLVNSWLRKEGYLQIHQKASSQESFPRTPLFRRQRKFSIRLPLSLVNKFFTHFDSRIVSFHRKLCEILHLNLNLSVQPEWSRSAAYAAVTRTNIGGIYMNDKKRFEDGILDENSYGEVRGQIIEKLIRLRNPDTNEVVIEDVWRKEDIYFGQHLELAPDILFSTSKEYQVRSNLFVDDVFSKALLADGSSQNNHSLEGIFLVFGNGVRKGQEISPVELCDLAPTILHILNIPIPEDMDGRVLVDVFEEECELASKQVTFDEVDAERDRIKKRLQKLKSVRRL
ncbi:MAG: alkaline phosphatase family protein, partial [Thermoplasmata archaeon]|nr:alkaline phosphatase family protein [Thermoplasmata archaeon]